MNTNEFEKLDNLFYDLKIKLPDDLKLKLDRIPLLFTSYEFGNLIIALVILIFTAPAIYFGWIRNFNKITSFIISIFEKTSMAFGVIDPYYLAGVVSLGMILSGLAVTTYLLFSSEDNVKYYNSN